MKRSLKPVAIIAGIVLVTLLLVALIAGVVNLVRGDEIVSIPKKTLDIEKEAKNSTATLNIRGPIVADENFYEIDMIITPTKRTFNVYLGYSETPSTSRTYSNTEKAYKEFLYSARKNYMFSTADPIRSREGHCRIGELRTYTLDGTDFDSLAWSNSCDIFGNIPNDNNLWQLYKDQFPDYTDLIQSITTYPEAQR